jgi:hypothetical protein
MSLGAFYWPVENREVWGSCEVGAIEADCDDQNVSNYPSSFVHHSAFSFLNHPRRFMPFFSHFGFGVSHVI